jgi:hypothetical protein
MPNGSWWFPFGFGRFWNSRHENLHGDGQPISDLSPLSTFTVRLYWGNRPMTSEANASPNLELVGRGGQTFPIPQLEGGGWPNFFPISQVEGAQSFPRFSEKARTTAGVMRLEGTQLRYEVVQPVQRLSQNHFSGRTQYSARLPYPATQASTG